MIGRIRGKIIEKQPPLLIIDINGVGYEINAPMSTFYQLPEDAEKEVSLYTQMIVREDAQLLYGFFQDRERELFRALIKVNGVGPKLALTILSGIETDAFVRLVRDNNAGSLTNIPGIGKKTAERLVVQMRDKLAGWETENVTQNDLPSLLTADQTTQDAIGALVALGYKPNEAKRAIGAIEINESMSSEDLIRNALKNMVQGK